MTPSEVRRVELREFRADLFGSLPHPASFVCRVLDSGVAFVVTTSQARWEAVRASGGVVFHGDEWKVITQTAENDRATAGIMIAWCRHKLAVKHWTLQPRDGLGGLVDVVGPQGWPVGRVLRAFGSELASVLA